MKYERNKFPISKYLTPSKGQYFGKTKWGLYTAQ